MSKTDDMKTASEEDTKQAEPENRLLFIGPKATAAAGGRAAGRRTKPPGSRFNKLSPEEEVKLVQEEEERQRSIADDPVVRASGGKDPIALLSTLKAEVAREAAALAYQRILLERQGKDITSVSGRRIDAFKKIADIEMEMRKIGFDQIDVYSEKFQKVFQLWIEYIRAAAEETLDPKTLDLFFNRLTSKLDGWEEKAEDLVR